MGRSFLSIRLAINIIAERWARASRTLGRDDKECGKETAAMAKRYASEAFVGCDIPLEGALFSSLVDIHRRCKAGHGHSDRQGDRAMKESHD